MLGDESGSGMLTPVAAPSFVCEGVEGRSVEVDWDSVQPTMSMMNTMQVPKQITLRNGKAGGDRLRKLDARFLLLRQLSCSMIG